MVTIGAQYTCFRGGARSDADCNGCLLALHQKSGGILAIIRLNVRLIRESQGCLDLGIWCSQ